MELFENRKNLIQLKSSKIKNIQNTCISLDISTDNINNISYLAIVLHYIHISDSSSCQYESILIKIFSFYERHTTENINIILKKLLNSTTFQTK